MFVPVSLVPKKTFSWIHLSQENLRMSSWVKHWELDGSLGKVSHQSIPVWNAQEEEFRIIILSYVISVSFCFFFFISLGPATRCEYLHLWPHSQYSGKKIFCDVFNVVFVPPIIIYKVEVYSCKSVFRRKKNQSIF